VTVPWRSIGFYALTGYKRLVKETIVEALEEIREQNPRVRILLVVDNYGSHHAKLTQQRADELGIEFVFIPPYSPTLNAIEPLWKDLKREISSTIFEGKDHFREFLSGTFFRLSQRLSLLLTGLSLSSRYSGITVITRRAATPARRTSRIDRTSARTSLDRAALPAVIPVARRSLA